MARGSKVWINGKIVPVEQAQISLFSHVLHYGTGAFEGIRAYKQSKGGGAVFRLREHLTRLEDSIKIMGFEMPYTVDQTLQAVIEITKANGFEECYIRPLAFIGDGPLGVFPGTTPPISLAILNWEWGSYLGDRGITEGAKLKTSTFIRPHPNSIMTRGKISGQYVTGVIAKTEARAQGFDEALFLDPEGYLSEGSGENLFMIRDGVVHTTALSSILNGITRNTVIQYFRHQGIPMQEDRFTRDDLWCADEVFLTGTAAEITPVSSIDSRKIGRGAQAGKPGPITLKLQRDYQAIVRGDLPAYGRTWLTPIQ
jgi:branched-chain amino acid aminotransferase